MRPAFATLTASFRVERQDRSQEPALIIAPEKPEYPRLVCRRDNNAAHTRRAGCKQSGDRNAVQHDQGCMGTGNFRDTATNFP